MLSYKETLIEVRRRLLALEDKRLGSRRYYTRGTDCYCAVGALAQEEARALSDNPWWNGNSVGGVLACRESDERVREFGNALRDLNEMALTQLQALNDRFVTELEWTEEDAGHRRYVLVLKELEDQIAKLGGALEAT